MTGICIFYWQIIQTVGFKETQKQLLSAPLTGHQCWKQCREKRRGEENKSIIGSFDSEAEREIQPSSQAPIVDFHLPHITYNSLFF